MRALLACLFMALAAPAVAQDAPIRSTIEAQLDAIKRDDFAAAFTFASPTIKRVFGTPENFGRMVREGYPMVYRPGAVKMLDLRKVAGGLWQRVMITDTGGRTHMLDYQMIEMPEGWQINAVQLLKAEGAGA
jgi:hypothetical protein